MIKAKFYGVLKAYMPETDDEGYFAVEEGLTVEELLEKTGASEKKVGMTILVNRVRKQKDYVLKDGDILTVMPLVAGG